MSGQQEDGRDHDEEPDEEAEPLSQWSALDKVEQQVNEKHRHEQDKLTVMKARRETEKAHSAYLRNSWKLSPAELRTARFTVEGWKKKHELGKKAPRVSAFVRRLPVAGHSCVSASGISGPEAARYRDLLASFGSCQLPSAAASTSRQLPAAASTSTQLPLAASTSRQPSAAASTSMQLPAAASTSRQPSAAASTSTQLPAAASTSRQPSTAVGTSMQTRGTSRVSPPADGADIQRFGVTPDSGITIDDSPAFFSSPLAQSLFCPVLNCQVKFEDNNLFGKHIKEGWHSPCSPYLHLLNGVLDSQSIQTHICPVCRATFQGRKQCMEHMVSDGHQQLMRPLRVAAYACPQCLAPYPELIACRIHMDKCSHYTYQYPYEEDVHGAETAEPVALPAEMLAAYLSKCHSTPWRLQCVDCGETDIDRPGGRDHLKQDHTVMSTSDMMPAEVFALLLKSYTCIQCLRLFEQLPPGGMCSPHQCGQGVRGLIIANDCRSFQEYVCRFSLAAEQTKEDDDDEKEEMLVEDEDEVEVEDEPVLQQQGAARRKLSVISIHDSSEDESAMETGDKRKLSPARPEAQNPGKRIRLTPDSERGGTPVRQNGMPVASSSSSGSSQQSSGQSCSSFGSGKSCSSFRSKKKKKKKKRSNSKKVLAWRRPLLGEAPPSSGSSPFQFSNMSSFIGALKAGEGAQWPSPMNSAVAESASPVFAFVGKPLVQPLVKPPVQPLVQPQVKPLVQPLVNPLDKPLDKPLQPLAQLQVQPVKPPVLPRQQAPKDAGGPSIEKLSQMNQILFLDLDNWLNFFSKLPGPLPLGTFVWGFHGGRTSWRRPKCISFQECDRAGCFYLQPRSGNTKNAADFALCLVVGRTDALLPKIIPFTILSGDKGFLELQRQMEESQRHAVVIDPHHKTTEEVYVLIQSVGDM